MYQEQFAQRLFELRLKKNVSARDMSLSLGQSESYINKIENGKAMPSMTVFFYICEYLGVTPSEFFDDNAEKNKQVNELSDFLQRLSAEQIKALKNLIEVFE